MKSPIRLVILMGLFLVSTFGLGATPAFAVAPAVNGTCSNGDNSNVCGPFATSVGAVIVVFVEINSNSAAVVSVTSVTDGGDTFAQRVSKTVTAPADFSNPYPTKVEIWSASHVAGATVTVTILLSGGTTVYNMEVVSVTNVPAVPIATATGSCIADPGTCGTLTTSSSNGFSPGQSIAVAAVAGWGISTVSAGTDFISIPGSCAGVQTCAEYSLTTSSPTSYPMSCGACSSANFMAAALAGAIFGVAGTFTCIITNMDAGNYLLPTGKVYDFRCTVQSSAISGPNARITDVSIAFNDSVNVIVLDYENDSAGANGFTGTGFRVLAGNAYIGFGTGSATSTIAAGVRQIVVDFKVSLSTAITDASNRGIELFASNINGITRGNEFVQTNYFNILNNGGSVSTLSSGSCARPKGYDIYEVSCKYSASPKSWMAVNSTYHQLQHYSAQFSVKLSCPTTPPCSAASHAYNPSQGDQFLWSTLPGVVPYTNPGDWKVRFGLYHYDNVSWVKGINVQIQLQVGKQDTNNEWTDLSVAWFSGNTLVRNDTINNWIQPSPLGQESFWIDLWYSNNNASTSEGGRVGSYYTGMHNTGFLWWTSWSPKLQNNTDSQVFVPLKDHTGKVMPVAAAQFSKVFMNMSRPYNTTHTGGYHNFNATTRQFKEQQFSIVTVGPMTSINTPLFNSAVVPIIQNTGFLSPLINAVNYVAKLFINGLVALGNVVWNGLGARFPWFTNAFGTFGTLVVGFATLLGSIGGYLGSFLTFLSTAFGPVTTIIGVISTAWATIQSIYLPIFGGANLGAFITVIVLWVFWGWFMENAEKNNTSAFVGAATLAWRVTNAILLWTWSLAKILIDTIEGLIP